ncbi:helix-turn-helix transcriptional regulator [Providencia stuartii]|uniref:helix-turn-helix transcriptional regulator n=1 Tax=Providencia stuartii TaxID=588 RepID=UPI00300D957F
MEMTEIKNKYSLSSENTQAVLFFYGYNTDRLVNEHERKAITGIARSTAFKLEKIGEFPARRKPCLGQKKCSWLLSELLFWVRNQPVANK